MALISTSYTIDLFTFSSRKVKLGLSSRQMMNLLSLRGRKASQKGSSHALETQTAQSRSSWTRLKLSIISVMTLTLGSRVDDACDQRMLSQM
jgi:hypothetical protein